MAEKKSTKKEVSGKPVAPKQAKKEYPKRAEQEFDPWSVLMYPHMAEKSMSIVDTQNKIVFVVRREANKPDIKRAFEKLFDVKVVDVKTERTLGGQKKAFIRLDPKFQAADIATKLGIL